MSISVSLLESPGRLSRDKDKLCAGAYLDKTIPSFRPDNTSCLKLNGVLWSEEPSTKSSLKIELIFTSTELEMCA